MRYFACCLCTAFLTVFTLWAGELPFDFKSTLIEETENHRAYHVTFPSQDAPFWEQAKQVKAFYYEPKPLPQNPAPAVLCLHILGGNGQLTQSIAAYFADHGMPAFMPQMPLFLERRPSGKMAEILVGKDGPKYLLAALKAVPGDMKRSLDFLASRPGVDASRLNVIGTSLGGILGVSTMANDTRLDKGIFLLAGGGLQEILESDQKETRPIAQAIRNADAQQTREFEALFAYFEPMNCVDALSAKAKDGRIRLYNAELDTLITSKFSNALAKGLGLELNKTHFILPNVDHYTAIVELPKLLDDALVFFGGQARQSEANDYTKSLFSSIRHWLESPAPDQASRLELSFNYSEKGQTRHSGTLHLNIQANRFNFALHYPKGIEGVRDICFGYDGTPWLVTSNGNVYKGEMPVEMDTGTLLPQQFHLYRKMASTLLANLAETGSTDTLSMLLKAKCRWEGRKFIARNKQGLLEIQLDENNNVPSRILFKFEDKQLDIKAGKWECGTTPQDNDFTPPAGKPIRYVDGERLANILQQVSSFAWQKMLSKGNSQSAICNSERLIWFENGLRMERPGEYPILFFAGSPEEIGRQHAKLNTREIAQTYNCISLVAGGYLFRKNQWFYDQIMNIRQLTKNTTPARYITELEAMASAAGISKEQGLEIALFPELFHCSGIAARGNATLNGKIVHARVLDYMRDIGLQSIAQVQVYIPEGYHPWISIGFAGFNGTVTAMNAEGLAMGEMGGRGEGKWNGLPMSYLMRRIMEECSTVAQARKIIEDTPLTCEYYYILSDKSGDMLAVEARSGERPTFLAPGESHPMLKDAFQDIVWITAPSRQKALCQRLHQYYGRIDHENMKQIIRRPVAMSSNLHNAIFLPETLDLHYSYADSLHPACDCKYIHLNLSELLKFYKKQISEK